MVNDLSRRGIVDRRVLNAMAEVARHRFVEERDRGQAYSDGPLPIGCGQTISQPYIVALMAQAAEIAPADRVLEIGTGSGYGAAVLSRLAGRVWTVERWPTLAARAERRLAAEGHDTVVVVVGDGTDGLEAEAPFDAIVVTASPADIPPALVDQLRAPGPDRPGGRLVIPVGPVGGTQHLLRLRRTPTTVETEDLGPVRFVPLVPEVPTGDDDDAAYS